MAYSTLPELRAYIGVDDTADDMALQVALSATEAMIDGYCERSFAPAGTAATTRVYMADTPYLVFIDDASSITLIETDPGLDGTWTDVWASSDWQAEPLNARSGGLSSPYTQVRAIGDYAYPVDFRAAVRVTATWGWASVPDVVQQATLLQAGRIFKRRDSVLGFAGGPETGLIRVGRAIDGDVAQLLAPYRKGASAIGGIA
jgi:hypothetical protein